MTAPERFIVKSHSAADSAKICDRLAEALRRNRHGVMRPLWADMTEAQRFKWREEADSLISMALRCGVYFDLGPREGER